MRRIQSAATRRNQDHAGAGAPALGTATRRTSSGEPSAAMSSRT
ncbi:hypothetical protein V4U86_09905 [Mycobacterium sp. AMU20-3851]